MKKLMQLTGLAACLGTVGVASAFAQVPNPVPVPAPEIAGSVLGLLMAGGVAVYVHRRRR